MLIRSFVAGCALVVANLVLAFLLNVFGPPELIVRGRIEGRGEIGVAHDAGKVISDSELARKELNDLITSQGTVRFSDLIQFDRSFCLGALLYLWAFVRMRHASLLELYALSLPGLAFVLTGALSWPYGAYFLLSPLAVALAERKKGHLSE